jgi:hypothetical protein
MTPVRALLGACLLLGACSRAGLQPLVEPVEDVDDRLDVEGLFCTSEPDEVVFPVKLLFVVDQSASLQCTDPENVRLTVLDRLGRSLDPLPNVRFGVVGFASWSRQVPFTDDWDTAAAALAPEGGQGGPATDYQGSLSTALRVVEEELVSAGPAENARTRLVVVFLSDGVPEPRCVGGCDDDDVQPDALYPVCNTTRPIEEGDYVDMRGRCPEYNQPNQILQKVRDLTALSDTYGVGELSLSTVLLFAPDDVVQAVCGDVASFGYVRDEAEPLLRAMAEEGGGTYRDADVSQDLDFLQIDVESLEAPYRIDSLLALNPRALPSTAGAIPDSDGDGLSDATEFSLDLDRLSDDSDGDGYGDLFEVRLADRGFDPLDPSAPTWGCDDRRDRDGDGLRGCEEVYLDTGPLNVDSDGDRLPDGLEWRYGLDPRVFDVYDDPDQDGVDSLAEIGGGTDPTRYDPESAFLDRTQIRLEPADPDAASSRCWVWRATGLPLVVPLGQEGDAETAPVPNGLNPIHILAHEAPLGLGGAGGRFHQACVQARYLGPTFKDPVDGEIGQLDPNWFEDLPAFDEATHCLPVGGEPSLRPGWGTE